jgi:hypothetical protein
VGEEESGDYEMSEEEKKPKTLDERLEALTYSVELLATMHKDTERQIKRLGKYIRGVAQMVLDHEARLRQLEGNDEDEDEE